jgi:hypothetical protein
MKLSRSDEDPALLPQRREKRTAATSPNTTTITAVQMRESPT